MEKVTPKQMFDNADFKAPQIEKEKMPDSVTLTNGRVIPMKSVRIKYLRNGDFGIYRSIEYIGFYEFMEYEEFSELLNKFLSAVFDKPYTSIEEKQQDESYVTLLKFDPFILELTQDQLTVEDLVNIIETAKKVNRIKNENFPLTPPKD